MCIDSLRYAFPGVSEYHFDDRVVDPGGVEQGCLRVPALMRRVVHRQPLHRPVPAATERVIAVFRTNFPSLLPYGQKREDTPADGNLADTSLSLAMPDVHIAFTDFNVLRS